MPNTNTNPSYDPEAFAQFFGTHTTDVNVPDDNTTNNPSVVDDPDPATQVDDPTTQTDPSSQEPGQDPDNSDGQSGTEGNQNTQQQSGGTNQNSAHLAFAQMRTQNKRQQQVLNSIAQQLGVQDTSDPDAVLTALQTLTTKAQAQKEGIPEAVLTRLQTLEAKEAEHRKESLLIAAGRGFQTLKTQHQLTDADLNNFADELIAEGINPYEQPVDLLKEYRTRHFDDLINAAVQRGVQQEAERSTKASRQSTTPSHSNGTTVSAPEGKISTVEGLNKWLEEHTK